MKRTAASSHVEARRLRLYHRLQLAAHLSAKEADRRMRAATGLTTAQVSVLSVIAASGAVNQRSVARQLGVNESAVTTMVRRLEAAGCLERRRSPDDQRTMVLELTTKGEGVLGKARGAFASVNEAFGRAFTAEEVERLASGLQRVAETFSPNFDPERSA